MKWLVALLTLVASVQAAEYQPVRCDTAKQYAGAPLYPAIDLTWDVAGSLDGTFDALKLRQLDAAVNKAMSATAAQSMTVAVAVPGIGMWTTERAAEGVTLTADMHYWASAGKMLTALTILKLAEESKLALSDPISKYVKGVPNGDAITIEALLNHTSGLFSVNEDLKVRRRDEPLTFSESLAILRKHGAMFCPGENWRYTNSGYWLLGHVLEVLEERPVDEVISAVVLDPLGLQNIRVLKPGDAASDVATLYSSDPKVNAMRPGSAGAAGPMAASSEAVVRLWHAVLSAKLVKPATLERMFKELYPMFGNSPYYGLGVMLYVVPQPDGNMKLWLGHSGGAPGVKAVFAYSPSDNVFVAVALSGDGSAEATANLLINALAD
jgi:D-alanyl-D-alanine carboxypeptidase